MTKMVYRLILTTALCSTAAFCMDPPETPRAKTARLERELFSADGKTTSVLKRLAEDEVGEEGYTPVSLSFDREVKFQQLRDANDERRLRIEEELKAARSATALAAGKEDRMRKLRAQQMASQAQIENLNEALAAMIEEAAKRNVSEGRLTEAFRKVNEDNIANAAALEDARRSFAVLDAEYAALKLAKDETDETVVSLEGDLAALRISESEKQAVLLEQKHQAMQRAQVAIKEYGDKLKASRLQTLELSRQLEKLRLEKELEEVEKAGVLGNIQLYSEFVADAQRRMAASATPQPPVSSDDEDSDDSGAPEANFGDDAGSEEED